MARQIHIVRDGYEGYEYEAFLTYSGDLNPEDLQTLIDNLLAKFADGDLRYAWDPFMWKDGTTFEDWLVQVAPHLFAPSTVQDVVV